MTEPRPITYVRFKTPTSIGGVNMDEWAVDRPHSTPLAGKINVRPGNPDLGEFRDSLVFECRIGKDCYDVEVPRANIAQIIRPAPIAVPPKEGKKP